MQTNEVKAGIDVSKEYFDVALAKTINKTTVERFSNDQDGFKKLQKKLSGLSVHAVMESTGVYHLSLATFLYQNGFRVSVVNPLVVRRYGQMKMLRAKTDRADALMLHRYASEQDPQAWQPDEKHLVEMQQLNMLLDGYEKDLTAARNRKEALKHQPVNNDKGLQSLERHIKALEKEIKSLEQSLEQIAEQFYPKQLEVLRSIPGIGKKTSIMLIVISGGFRNFTSEKKLASYIGISPRIYESGSSVKGRGRISKMGMSRIRKMLYMCSWTAKTRNHACIAMYKRLKGKGKPERVIKIAIAHKLLKIAFNLIRKMENFKENYIPKTCF